VDPPKVVAWVDRRGVVGTNFSVGKARISASRAAQLDRARGCATNGPFDSLEPVPEDHARESVPLYPEVGTWRTLVRGARKRCPRCGSRDTFVSWFQMRVACPVCEWRFEKETGGYLGAMTLNYSAAIGLWLVVLVVGLILTVPDVPVMPLIVASVIVLVLVPLWFYPRSKTIWAAVEYLVLRSDPDYRSPTRRDPRAKDLE
jgi:uncharacterized protein (DUF983 family)